jgi:hypothetical protein
MLMPEASMHEDRRAISGKHNVWRSGQLPFMQSKSQASLVKKGTNKQFRARVLAPDRPHDPSA